VQVGDVLEGIVQINTVEQPGGGSPIPVPPGSELTAIFEVQVATATGSAGAYQFTFTPYAPFAAAAAGLGFSHTTGAEVAFVQDNAAGEPDFTRTSTLPAGAGIALGFANASDGTPFWLLGSTTSSDFWNAFTTTNDTATIAAGVPSTIWGSFGIGLALLDSEGGVSLLPELCTNTIASTTGSVNACGNGTISSPDGGEFPVWDQTNFVVRPIGIPEPATLSFFSLGLIALGYSLSRRRTKTA